MERLAPLKKYNILGHDGTYTFPILGGLLHKKWITIDNAFLNLLDGQIAYFSPT